MHKMNKSISQQFEIDEPVQECKQSDVDSLDGMPELVSSSDSEIYKLVKPVQESSSESDSEVYAPALRAAMTPFVHPPDTFMHMQFKAQLKNIQQKSNDQANAIHVHETATKLSTVEVRHCLDLQISKTATFCKKQYSDFNSI